MKQNFKNKLKINLFDESFVHVDKSNHGMVGQAPSNFEWIRDNTTSNDKISVFTEDYIFANLHQSNAILNVGWLIECREIAPFRYENFKFCSDKLDFVITHDQILLDEFPKKTRFAPFGGCWISKENRSITTKEKLLSTIFSNKNFTSGHNLRHQVYNTLGRSIDFFGGGCGKKLKEKDSAIRDYKFSIVIENSNVNNYFTEKLLDCFAYGTVPIYYGCPNIANFFDAEGIISFNNVEQLEQIVRTLNIDMYTSRINAIKRNFDLVSNFDIPEDWIFENIFKLTEIK